MTGQQFRAGVVIVVEHPTDGRVLGFERADAPGSWQLPQGGLEAGEEPIDAAWRELGEETGLGRAQVAADRQHPHWVAYEWPAEVRAEQGKLGKRRGQVQQWFFFRALSAEVRPTPDGSEFVAWKWMTVDELVAGVVTWRRQAYAQVLTPDD